MPKNTNEKSKNENTSASFKAATSPIVSVVKNEIHPSGRRSARKSNNASSIITDPNGSYTGTPLNPNEQPVQDVDDL